QADGTLGNEEPFDLPYGPSEYAIDSIGVGDVNGDGKTDITIADYASGLIVMRQLSSSWPTTPTWQVESSPVDLAQAVSTSAALQVRFGRALDASSVAAATTLRDGVTGANVAGSATYDS